jgi:hypothetical protein
MDKQINFDNLRKQFGRIGARLETQFREGKRHRPWSFEERQHRLKGEEQRWSISTVEPFSANIRTDDKGEHFSFLVGDNSKLPTEAAELVKLQVLDVQPKERHLVLQVVTGQGRNLQTEKMLMGHDERHWFIAGVPSDVTTVKQAKDSLKPAEVQALQKQQKVKRSKRNRRKNETFVRQGEWFFVPEPTFAPGKFAIISKNEPLRRGRSKPHVAQEACRVGGSTVMFHPQHAPNGISMDRYNRLRNVEPAKFRSGAWRQMTRNAGVYVRGTIKHTDHKTLKLRVWHRVVGNVEPRMQTVAFLD